MANGELRLQESGARTVERRQCTVLFCDIVDFTGLSRKLDYEDLFLVRRQFETALESVMKRHGGSLVQNIGDAVVVLFSYPVAQEDAPERAMRAALDVVTALGPIETMPGKSLQVRVGIATGETIVGYVSESEFAKGIELTGLAPTLASRLQASAEEPGQVIVSDVTRQLVGGLFEFQELEPRALKGFEGKHRRWCLQGEATGLSRFAAVRRISSHMMGRDREVSELAELRKRAIEGDGQIVLVQGEAGIGKSRLVESVCAALPEGSHALWRYSCSPHASGTVLYPLIRAMEVGAGITRGDSAATRLAKLENLVAAGPLADRSASVLPYLARMLDIPLEGSQYTLVEETPEWRRKRTIDVLLDWVIGQTDSSPVLVLVEDLHWADPSTLDLINRLVERISNNRILVLATARPEFSATWAESARTHIVTLTPLDHESRVEIVRTLIGGADISPQMIDSISVASDGNPLHLEELTRSALELPGSNGSLVGPSALNDLLMARLDRLSTAKRFAQEAAAIGREFSRELMLSVSGADEAALDRAMEQLDAADLILTFGKGVATTYRFRHALIRDAAYDTMLRLTRKALHERIGRTLEEAFPDIREAMPELVAHHFEIAQQWMKAVEYYRTAGKRAATRAANAEASGHLDKALALLLQHPADPGRDALELDLQVQTGLALSSWQGYAAPAVETAFRRARQICEAFGDNAELFPVLRGLWSFHVVRGQLDEAMALAQSCLRLGRETGRAEQVIEGLTVSGYINFYHGRVATGLALLEDAWSQYVGCDGKSRQFPSTQDPGVASLCLASHALCLQGRLAEARDRLSRALDLAGTLGRDTEGGSTPRPFEQAFARAYGAMLECLMGNFATALEHAHACIAISQQYGFTDWLGVGYIQASFAGAMLGGATDCIDPLANTFAAYRASGAELGGPIVHGDLAETYLALGRHADAEAAVDAGLRQSAETGEQYVDAHLLRIRGEILVAQGRTKEARATLEESIRLAQTQGATLFEVRAARTLGALGDVAALEHARTIAASLQAANLSPYLRWEGDVTDVLPLTPVGR